MTRGILITPISERLRQRIDIGFVSFSFSDFYLLTYDQILLHAFLLLHENSHEHYTYLICHGIKHQIEDLSSIADRFYRDFGNILIIDYRGFGNSTGKQSERGAYIDVQTAFDYLLTLKEIDRRRIVVYGVSMGVALVIQLASEQHNSEHIHACILENGFTSVQMIAALIIDDDLRFFSLKMPHQADQPWLEYCHRSSFRLA